MKYVWMLSAFLAFSASSFAQTKLTVTIDKIKNEKGSIRIGIFDSEDGFLKKPIDGKSVKVAGNHVTVVFDKLKPGTYAVSVIHDENDNAELDTKALGIPKEGVGFSNNVMGKFGPPSFQDASIKLAGEESLNIDLKYL
jgi:uncharacterized protein (DUF2141 family)